MKIGFTGTQKGMNECQLAEVTKELICISGFDGTHEFHHGDCIGADEQAVSIARSLGYWIVMHPPIYESKRAWTTYDEAREPAEYLVRNHNIVDEVDYLIVTPKEMVEVLRSGTWATYRYALKKGRKYIVYKLESTL